MVQNSDKNAGNDDHDDNNNDSDDADDTYEQDAAKREKAQARRNQLEQAYDEQKRVMSGLQPHLPEFDSLSSFERQQRAILEKDKGNEAFKAGDLYEALSFYSRSLNLDSTNKSNASIVYANRGLVYHKLKRFEEAEADYSQSLDRDPAYIKAWSRRATTRYSRGKYALSISDCLEALRIKPQEKEILKQKDEAEKKLCEVEGDGAAAILRDVYRDPSYKSPFYKATKSAIPASKPAAQPKATESKASINPGGKSGYRRMKIEEVEDEEEDGDRAAPASEELLKPVQTVTASSSSATSATNSAPRKKVMIEEIEETEPVSSAANTFASKRDEAQTMFQSGQIERCISLASEVIAALESQSNDDQHKLLLASCLELRAAAHAQVSSYRACLKDCTQAISILSSFAAESVEKVDLAGKVHLRKAFALESMENYHEAVQDLRTVCNLLSSSSSSTTYTNASRALPRVSKLAHSQLLSKVEDISSKASKLSDSPADLAKVVSLVSEAFGLCSPLKTLDNSAAATKKEQQQELSLAAQRLRALYTLATSSAGKSAPAQQQRLGLEMMKNDVTSIQSSLASNISSNQFDASALQSLVSQASALLAKV